jgi:hypothetical protein
MPFPEKFLLGFSLIFAILALSNCENSTVSNDALGNQINDACHKIPYEEYPREFVWDTKTTSWSECLDSIYKIYEEELAVCQETVNTAPQADPNNACFNTFYENTKKRYGEAKWQTLQSSSPQQNNVTISNPRSIKDIVSYYAGFMLGKEGKTHWDRIPDSVEKAEFYTDFGMIVYSENTVVVRCKNNVNVTPTMWEQLTYDEQNAFYNKCTAILDRKQSATSADEAIIAAAYKRVPQSK